MGKPKKKPAKQVQQNKSDWVRIEPIQDPPPPEEAAKTGGVFSNLTGPFPYAQDDQVCRWA